MSGLKAAIVPVTPFQQNCAIVFDERSKRGVVVDPGGDAVGTCEYYFAANDWTPAAVLLTNARPGHAAAAYDLAAGWDIPVYLHRGDRDLLAEGDYGEPDDVREVADGQQLDIGGVEVSVAHLGSPTPGSVAYWVTADTDEGPIPVVFSGDTLLLRAVGHDCDGAGDPDSDPDLVAAVAAKLMVLDDKTVVMPGHGSSTSIGAERRANPHLKDLL